MLAFDGLRSDSAFMLALDGLCLDSTVYARIRRFVFGFDELTIALDACCPRT